MKSQSDSFGNLTNFNVGDLVFWKNKGNKELGLVTNLFFSIEMQGLEMLPVKQIVVKVA